MARRNWFVGKSQAWLEAELAKAQQDLSAGSASTGGTEGDAAFTEEVAWNPRERIYALLYSLHLLDPTTYPNNVARLTRITRAVFAS